MKDKGLIKRVIICVFIITLLLSLSCGSSDYRVLKGKLSFSPTIGSEAKSTWINPSKIILTNIIKKRYTSIPLEIYNEGAITCSYVIDVNRVPDYTEDGYIKSELGKGLWVIPSKTSLSIPGSSGKKVFIMVGLDDGANVNNNTEFWISIKRVGTSPIGSEWILRCLIKK